MKAENQTSPLRSAWSALQWHVWSRWSLRRKLSLGVWLSVLPVSLITSLLALEHAKSVVEAQVKQDLTWDAKETSEAMQLWQDQQIESLNFTAEMPDIRALEPRLAQAVLDRRHIQYKHQSFILIGPDGTPIAKSGSPQPRHSVLKASRRQPDPGSAYAKAWAGQPATEPITTTTSDAPCIATSVPVYRSSNQSRTTPDAILSSCMSINSLSRVSGINQLFQLTMSDERSQNLMDLDNNRQRGYTLLLVQQPGFIIQWGRNDSPHKNERNRLNPNWVLRSAWAPMVREALRAPEGNSFRRLKLNGNWYLVAFNRLHHFQPHRISVMAVDERTAFATLDLLFRWMVLGTLIALAASSLAIGRICRTLSKPLDQAGEALARISRGEFGTMLPIEGGEVGRLFAYINQASRQLQEFLAENETHAITDAQLHQARLIQNDFLIQQLPQSDAIELAADFDPAYEIGADWYDALQINGATIVIVADVCDKGIPSALYMSVFRSLLRLELSQQFSHEQAVNNPDYFLCRAISETNRYMAETHGKSGMFATIFVGAFLQEQHLLSYVVAGHETPLVFHRGEVISLNLGGPAVGVFPKAQFKANQIPLHPGDYLLAFSDGLPDSRNSTGESFAIERTKTLFRQLSTQGLGADALLQAIKREVEDYRGSSEQFDDLTLLTLRVKSGA